MTLLDRLEALIHPQSVYGFEWGRMGFVTVHQLSTMVKFDRAADSPHIQEKQLVNQRITGGRGDFRDRFETDAVFDHEATSSAESGWTQAVYSPDNGDPDNDTLVPPFNFACLGSGVRIMFSSESYLGDDDPAVVVWLVSRPATPGTC